MSVVEIALPRLPQTGEDIPSFFKQLELCVHHARKAYQVQIENGQGPREDDFVQYATPSLDETVAEIVANGYMRKESPNNYHSLDTVTDIESNLSDEHENIVIRINVE
jgi:hypothetical protein